MPVGTDERDVVNALHEALHGWSVVGNSVPAITIDELVELVPGPDGAESGRLKDVAGSDPDALAREYGLASPFAAGYVTAHEGAHHVQHLLGLGRQFRNGNGDQRRFPNEPVGGRLHLTQQVTGQQHRAAAQRARRARDAYAHLAPLVARWKAEGLSHRRISARLAGR